ncbi:MAG TPA: hypothetical protein VNL77_18490 [Roseiflexaceae bacterium]|nr:hypothetical protein [Roseiflexaceae bacterium]
MHRARTALSLMVGGLLVFALVADRKSAHAATLIVPDDHPTIQAAVDAAIPGATILVRPGTYHENLTLRTGVTLTAERFDPSDPTNNTTVIDGGTAGVADVIGIPAGTVPRPTIRGFVIRNGVEGITPRAEAIIEHNYFVGSSDQVAYEAGGGGVNRHNVYFNAGDDAIDVDNLTRPVVIEHNRLMYSGNDGIEMRLQDSTAPAWPVEIIVRHNEIIGSVEDGIQLIDYTAPPQDTNRRLTVTGNLIAANARAGIGLMPGARTHEDYSGAAVAEAVRVYGNTLYGNDYGLSGGGNFVAFNNIIAGSVTRGAWRVQGEPGGNAVVAHTLFYGNGVDAEQSALGPGNLFGLAPRFASAPNPGRDGIWRTPDDDFSGLAPQAGSPAIDAGVIQFAPADGLPVPPAPIVGFAGRAPDLGWREFGAPPPRTPIPTDVPATALPPRLALPWVGGQLGR